MIWSKRSWVQIPPSPKIYLIICLILFVYCSFRPSIMDHWRIRHKCMIWTTDCTKDIGKVGIKTPAQKLIWNWPKHTRLFAWLVTWITHFLQSKKLWYSEVCCLRIKRKSPISNVVLVVVFNTWGLYLYPRHCRVPRLMGQAWANPGKSSQPTCKCG